MQGFRPCRDAGRKWHDLHVRRLRRRRTVPPETRKYAGRAERRPYNAVNLSTRFPWARTMTSCRWILTCLLAAGLPGCDAFSQSEPVQDATEGEVQHADEDPRPRVAEITSLAVETVTGGVIVLATALPSTQGWFKPELVSDSPDGKQVGGVLSYSFRALPPRETQPPSTERSRTLTAAAFVPQARLADVRSVRVSGVLNSRSVRP